jgi:methylmalonyl-CoA mutase cobalamin-binding domain/chain
LRDALSSVPADPRARCVVVATPSHQAHDLGAYLAALVAAAAGWRVVYLGSDLPAVDIARAASQADADVVALSIVRAGDVSMLDQELRGLRDALRSHIRLVVGGRGAIECADTLRDIGAVHLCDTREFVATLERP